MGDILGVVQAAYVKAETVYGKAVGPAGEDAFDALSVRLTGSEERALRDDRFTDRSYKVQTRGRRAAEFEIEKYILGGGSSGLAPDEDALYLTTFAKRNPGNLTVASNPSVTGCTVTDALGTAAGDAFHFGGQIVWLQTVVGDAVTWSPPLATAPEVDDTLQACTTYRLQTKPSESVTITHRLGITEATAKCLSGGVGNEWNWNLGNGDRARMTVSGFGKEVSHFFPMTGATVEAGAENTEVSVDEVNAYIEEEEVGSGYYQIGSEIVRVVGVDRAAKELTVERGQFGTTAAAHDDEEAQVYSPQPDTHGTPLPDVIGSAFYHGAPLAVTGATVTLRENAEAQNDEYGEASATGAVYGNKREVEFALEGYCETTSRAWLDAEDDTPRPIYLQAGESAGHLFGMAVERAQFERPEIGSETEGRVTLRLPGKGMGSETVGDDELIIAYG